MARGDGSVERLKSGRYRARIDLGTDGSGRRNRPSKTFGTRTEANNWKREQLRLHDAGQRADAGTETLGEWLTRWLVTRQAEMEPRGYETYEQHVRLYLTPRLGHVLLRDLQPKHVRAFDERLIADGRSVALRRTVGKTLRQSLDDAVSQRLLASNPAKAVKLPRKRRHEFAVWTPPQCRAFLTACASDRYHALFALALDSGMRLGELLALHWPEVNLEAGTVAVERSLETRGNARRLKQTKTQAGRRRITLAPPTVELLRTHRQRQERAGFLERSVFTDTAGGYVHLSHLRLRHFRPAMASAGVPRIRFHDLRHTCATLLLMSGVNVKAVSVRMGHSSPVVTLTTYAHYLPEMADQMSGAIGAAIYPPCPTAGQNSTDAAT